MAEQRQGLRFRLPWQQAVPAPRPPLPAPSAPRPPLPAPSASRAQPTLGPRQPPPAGPAPRPPPQVPTAETATTAQRPPFRPAGSAQAPSPQAQPSPRTESQPSSPSSATTQSRVTSQPKSPSRATTQSLVKPPSPSRVAPQPQAAPQPQSPPKLTSHPAVQASPESSPYVTATQTQSAEKTVGLDTSEQIQPTTQEGFQPSAGFTELPMSVPQEEPNPVSSWTVSQELQPYAERASENVMDAQNQTSQVALQPNGMQVQPSESSVPVAAATPASTASTETPVLTQKSDSSPASAKPEPLQESDGNSKRKLEEEIVQQTINEQKINGAIEESKERIVTKLFTAASESKVPTERQADLALDAEQQQLEKEQIVSRKDTLANSNTNGKQTKTAISQLRDKKTVSESHYQPTTSNGRQGPLHKEIGNNISKFVHKMAAQQPEHPIDQNPVSVITLAGESRGATMQLGSESSKREEAVPIHRSYKINPDDSTQVTTDGEESSDERRSKESKIDEDQASKSYINSNVQGINNSIMFSGSITERNPGVHLVFSRNLKEPKKPTRRIESIETHKAAFNATPVQALTYEPRVRRRCLRGLLMEPSDSDADNPEKPRRHGCLYACKDKSKDKEKCSLN